MVKKVVALETCGVLGITAGEKYVVKEEYKEFYSIINDYNKHTEIWKKRFKPLEEEVEIKVGSEWVLKAYEKRKCKVLYVGKQSLFGEWYNGTEGEYDIEDFLDKYEPAPVRRTVWLNVYPNDCTIWYTKEGADSSTLSGLLYQQEVELIDPREGDKK